MMFILTVGLPADSAWIAQAGLTLILFSLLVGGVFLLILGARDLMRDFHHFLQARSHENSDGPHSRAA